MPGLTSPPVQSKLRPHEQDAALGTERLMKNHGMLRRIARACSSSFLMRRGRKLWEQNAKDWNFPLSKADKLWCGGYLIASDYAAGQFPPRFEDQARAYQNEIDYHSSLPGLDLAQMQRSQITKPFWNASSCARFLRDFNRLFLILESHGVKPPQRLLELGCGSGWMAEMLAHAGYRVTGTTISKHDIEIANAKAAAMKLKDPKAELQFVECPMESVNGIPDARDAFDAVFVYEALHHAFDWRKTVRASADILKAGGWLLLANEPNRLHTFIAYRVARLSRTHEIGFSKDELLRELHGSGFGQVEVLRPRFNNRVTPFWIMARKDWDGSRSSLPRQS
jgi:2-polyprenyl-3-methyl-5-hydroxy-6-metoxy-1,4-benzoquinol methylase